MQGDGAVSDQAEIEAPHRERHTVDADHDGGPQVSQRLQAVHNALLAGLCAQMKQRHRENLSDSTLGTADTAGYLDWTIPVLLHFRTHAPALFQSKDHPKWT
jgi:hypothetical protein